MNKIVKNTAQSVAIYVAANVAINVTRSIRSSRAQNKLIKKATAETDAQIASFMNNVANGNVTRTTIKLDEI